MRSQGTVLRHVGRRVAELRAARGWTQEVFAEQAGVSVGYVRQVESGKENLTLVSLVKLAALLGSDAADLFVPPTSNEVRRGRPPKRATGTEPAGREEEGPADAADRTHRRSND